MFGSSPASDSTNSAVEVDPNVWASRSEIQEARLTSIVKTRSTASPDPSKQESRVGHNYNQNATAKENVSPCTLLSARLERLPPLSLNKSPHDATLASVAM
jgi:hypothetical protein